jgi:hypothetical protein
MYAYQPMKDASSQIRLLRPTPCPVTAELSYSLEVFDLDDAPPYLAVSYTWGPELPLDRINIDGYEVLVRKHCAYALRQLHRHAPGERIWIDSVCINQNDIEEKAQQVFHMAEIYTRADCVKVSLGPECANVSLLGDTSKRLQDLLNREDFYSAKWNGEAVAALQSSTLDLRSVFQQLFHVVDQSYWTRLWIVQEVLVARYVDILCDTHSFSLLEFANIWSALNSFAYTQDEFREFYRGNVIPWLFMRDREDRKNDFHKAQAVMRLLRNKGCADIRDRVYGALSIIPWSKSIPRLKPDYGLSVLELAMQALRHLQEFVDGISGVVLRTYQIRGEIELIVTLLDIDEEQPEFVNLLNARKNFSQSGLREQSQSYEGFGESAEAISSSPRVHVQPEGVLPLYIDKHGRLSTCLHKDLFLVARYSRNFFRTSDVVDSLEEESSCHRKLYCDGVAAGIITCRAEPGDLLVSLDDELNSSTEQNDNTSFTGGAVLRHIQGNLCEIVGHFVLWVGYCEPPKSTFEPCPQDCDWSAEEHTTLKLFFDPEDLFVSVCEDMRSRESPSRDRQLERAATSLTRSRFSSYGWYGKYMFFSDRALDECSGNENSDMVVS